MTDEGEMNVPMSAEAALYAAECTLAVTEHCHGDPARVGQMREALEHIVRMMGGSVCKCCESRDECCVDCPVAHARAALAKGHGDE